MISTVSGTSPGRTVMEVGMQLILANLRSFLMNDEDVTLWSNGKSARRLRMLAMGTIH
jgi:hypothetical protein